MWTIVILWWGAGCAKAPGSGDDVEDTAATPCAGGEVRDGDVCVPEACGVGPWGDAALDDGAVYVDLAAVAAGDGSAAAPLSTIQAGLDLAGAHGGGTVAVAAGTYPENLVLTGEHDGVRLRGRCAALVTVDGVGDDGAATIGVGGGGAGAATVRTDLEGLTLTRGFVGLVADAGAQVAARDLVVMGNVALGVFAAAGAEVELTDVTVTDTQAMSRSRYGRGVQVESGATLVGTRLTVTGNVDVGLYVGGAGSSVTLRDGSITATAPSADGEGGRGIDVEAGGALDASGLLVADNGEMGLYVAGSGAVASLADVAVRGTRSRADGLYGRAIDVEGGAELRGVGLVVDGNDELGVFVSGAGTAVELVDSAVGGTVSTPAGLGWGVLVQSGGALDATRLRVEGNTDVGLAAFREDTVVTLADCEVSGTVAAADGGGGRGLDLESGARLDATDLVVDGNAGTGVLVYGEGTTARLERATIGGGARPAGRGVGVAGGASLLAAELTVEGVVDLGVYAADAGTSVTAEGLCIRAIGADAGGAAAFGLFVSQGAAVVASDLAVEGVQGVGLGVVDEATRLEVIAGRVAEIEADAEGAFGGGVQVAGDATFTAGGLLVERATGIGVVVSEAAATLDGVTIRGTRRPRAAGMAVGLVAQYDAVVAATNLVVEDTDGVGVYAVIGGAVDALGCSVVGNAFAGALVTIEGASLTLRECDIADTAPDAEYGGGFGVYAAGDEGPATLRLDDSTVGEHRYAAVWLDGPGRYEIVGSELVGGAGFLLGATSVHGDALFARNGVSRWDGSTGMRIDGGRIVTGENAGVLLHGAAATLTDNAWEAGSLDLLQQACDGVAPLEPDELVGVPTAVVCPAGNTLIDDSVGFSTLYLAEAGLEE